MKALKYLVMGLLTVILSSCFAAKQDTEVTSVKPEVEIAPKTISAKRALSQIPTLEKKMALTFNGLADEETMNRLLAELDRFEIKATIFYKGCGLPKTRS